MPRWQTPAVIVASGSVIALLAFGPRSTMGLILQPMTQDTGWTRDVFALAIAVQHIVWGAAQPLGGAIADRFGSVRALCTGAILYSSGLVVMANATTTTSLMSAGALIGFGLAGASFNIVLAAFGKLLPERSRPLAIGIGAAAGSFGQFLFSPLCVDMLEAYGWRATLLSYGGLILFVLPLSLAVATPGHRHETLVARVSLRSALREAVGHRSYILLVGGYFTSGFHVAFVNMHLPAYLVDNGIDAAWAGWVNAFVGLFNILGSVAAGWLCGRYPNRYVLFGIYALRAAAIGSFLATPVTPTTALLFGAGMGSLWLSATAPAAGLVAHMFGTQHMAALFGLIYFFHQVGAFLGVWLGGVAFKTTGSYEPVWWLLVLLALAAALASLCITERPREHAVTAA
jgi:MFS family permease